MQAAKSSRSEAPPVGPLAFLSAFADQVQRSRDEELVYQQAADGLRAALGFDAVVVQVLDGGLLRVVASSGLSEAGREGIEGFAPWPVDARGADVAVLGTGDGDGRLDPIAEALASEGIQRLACVPVLSGSALLGAVMLARRGPASFETEELESARVIAGHLSFVIWRSGVEWEKRELLRRFEVERSVLESVVKQMPAGVILADVPSGRVIMANVQADGLWGRRLQGTVSGDWRGVSSAGEPLAAGAWPLARSVETGEWVDGEEIAIDREGGDRRVVRMSSAPVVDDGGRRLLAVAVVHDVTEERGTEARRAFVEGAASTLSESLNPQSTLATLARRVVGHYADWCVIHRRDGDRLDRVSAAHVDPGFEEAVQAVAHGSVPLQSVHPVARSVRTARPWRVVDPVQAREAVRHEGDAELPEELAPRSAMILPMVSRGRGLGAMTVVRTEGRYDAQEEAVLVELAERAAQAVDNALLYEQARTADRQKASFLAVMSHEFRTPLSAILGYADIMTAEVHGALNPKQQGHLERVKASVRHLSHLVDEILTFASMEAGRERIRPEPADAAKLTREIAELMKPISDAARLELSVHTPLGDTPLMVDPSKLRQILINLVSNAVKYTPSGRVEMTLSRDEDTVRIRVADTGPGIPDEHLEDVFEPFWQVETEPGRRVPGSGLGLSVARRLARLMGGDIELKSQVGIGSEFTLVLPAVAPVGVAAESGS
jgi:signal transduction histidine kinase